MTTYQCPMCGNIWDHESQKNMQKCKFCGTKVEGKPACEDLSQEELFARGVKILENARSFAAFETAENIFLQLGDYEGAADKLRCCRELKAVAKESDSVNKNNRRLGLVLGFIAVVLTITIWAVITDNTIAKREALAGRYLISESFVSENGEIITFDNDGKATVTDGQGKQTQVKWEVDVTFFGDVQLTIGEEPCFLRVNPKYKPEYILKNNVRYNLEEKAE